VKLNRRSALAGVAALSAASLCLSRAAFAQGFPNKPIKIVVPFAAGSATDLTGRMEISPLGLDEFAAYVKSETEWWTKSIKAAGIEPE
jgi:tripartite-type tricarboxylate transporter receptor subunit TctC